jgi:hypothetical protein
MAIFQRKRFVWNEPWFFQQRIRPLKAWVLFSLLLLGVAIAIAAALYFSAPAGRPMHLLEVTGLGLGIAAALWWVLDGSNTRRQAVLFEGSLVVGGDMGKYSYPTTYQLSGITNATILNQDQSRWPSPALLFRYAATEELIGIEAKVRLGHLAQALHDAGVPVSLDGWLANQESEFGKAFSWSSPSSEVIQRATIETLPPGTPSMMTPGGMLLAIVRQCWAIGVWLLITGAAIYYGYQNWNNLGIVQIVLLFAVPIGLMWIAGQFTDRFASASTSQGLIRMAKSQLLKRSGIELAPDSEEWLPVEILLRDQFDKTIHKIHEMGFLQPDPRSERILFEGKQQRWSMPAQAIRSVAIEEIQSGTPGQSVTGAINYFVVVRLVADGEQEFGFRFSKRDFGEMNDIKRAEGAIRVFEAFESILPPAPTQTIRLSAADSRAVTL